MTTRQKLQSKRPQDNTFVCKMTPGNGAGGDLRREADRSLPNNVTSQKEDTSIYYLFFDKKDPAQVTLLRQNIKTGPEITRISVPAGLFNGGSKDGGAPWPPALYPNTEYIDWLYAQFDSTWQASDASH